MQYRKARLDEVQEVAQVCADAFEDYPYLSMIASNLKKPEQYKEFVLALQEILVRLAIKRDSCLVAEKDGRIVAAAILQHQTISMLNYLQNGATKLFRFISITKLFKYFNFVEESERHLEDSADDARREIYRAIHKKKKWMAEGTFDRIIAVTDKETTRKAVEQAKAYILGNWSGIMVSMKSKDPNVCCSAEGHVSHVYADRMSSRPLGWCIRFTPIC